MTLTYRRTRSYDDKNLGLDFGMIHSFGFTYRWASFGDLKGLIGFYVSNCMLIVGRFQAFLTVGRSKTFAREGLVIGDEDGFVKLRFI